MYKISIVAPVYGVEKYINQFLDSIRKQTFNDFEVILVDDGSKDDCPRILDEFKSESDRYHVIHQNNSGVSKARNAGLEHIDGEYVYIVDSDDWLEPTALQDLWEAVERTGADLIYGDFVLEYPNGSFVQKCFPREFFTDNPDTIDKIQFSTNLNNIGLKISAPEFREINHMGGAPWRCMIRSSLIKENHLSFNPIVRGLGDDIIFSLELYEYVKKITYISKIIYHYRELNVSYSHGYKANYFENVGLILKQEEMLLQKKIKNDWMWGSYYLRVLIYLDQGMKRYFHNKDNNKRKQRRYHEYINLVETEPYKSSIINAPYKIIKSKRLRFKSMLLKLKLRRVFWIVTDKF